MAPSHPVLLPLPLSNSRDGLGHHSALAAPELNILDVEGKCGIRYERKLGDGELSYYLPGRATGVNDMYLHLGLRAPGKLMHHSRVLSVWTILRLRHPLLASHVVMHDYDDVRFIYSPALSPAGAESEAAAHFSWDCRSKDELIDQYLNGPRTLSDERLSFLTVSQPFGSDPYPSPPMTPDSDAAEFDSESWENDKVYAYEWLMYAAHFIGDGMALHAFANDFFCLVGSSMSDQDLRNLLNHEWQVRCNILPSDKSIQILPLSFEASLPPTRSKLHRAVGRIDFDNFQRKQIGGHAFPRRKATIRHTTVLTAPFDEKVTREMLRKCKAESVSIAGVFFAICNIVWARMTPADRRALPMMMYAAMNIRPCLIPRPLSDSYWFLAVGYFTVVLPCTIPSGCGVSKMLWHRARSARAQITQALKTPMLPSRCCEMSLKRGVQSRAWAREDDGKEFDTRASVTKPLAPSAPKASPSTALLGLSMLGNLDAVYKHPAFPEIELLSLTTGSRQRHGGMLLFGYTFAGKLWASLGYDKNGFEPKPVELFWDGLIAAMREFLL